MSKRAPRVLFIGDGSWGTALAVILAKNDVPTTLWSAFPEQAADLAEHRENRPFLPLNERDLTLANAAK
mgnify:CR=1 FL=1